VNSGNPSLPIGYPAYLAADGASSVRKFPFIFPAADSPPIVALNLDESKTA